MTAERHEVIAAINDFLKRIPAKQRKVFVLRYWHSEKDHGRIETREYFLSTDIEWLETRDEWANLNAIGMVRSKVIEGENESEFTRYFITSLTDINEFAYAVRKHWSIENQLHWYLDVIFREDAAKARNDNSPLNLNVF